MRKRFLVALASSLLALCSCENSSSSSSGGGKGSSLVTGTLSGKLVLPPSNDPYAHVPVTLNGGEFSSLANSRGEFAFFDVQPGIYNLEVLATEHAFPQVKVKFVQGRMDSPVCNLYVFVGAERQSVSCIPL